MRGNIPNETAGSFEGAKTAGSFTVTAPTEGNHGPVRVVNQFHFAYEDATPYYPVGTTCYAWAHQPEEVHRQTLSELDKGYFRAAGQGIYGSAADTGKAIAALTLRFVGKRLIFFLLFAVCKVRYFHTSPGFVKKPLPFC